MIRVAGTLHVRLSGTYLSAVPPTGDETTISQKSRGIYGNLLLERQSEVPPPRIAALILG